MATAAKERNTSLSPSFFSPVQLKRGAIEELWLAPGVQPG